MEKTKGKGPGEILGAIDFTIDPFKQTIDIYDRANKKVVSYDNSGVYISEVNIPFWNMGIEMIRENVYALYRYDYSYGNPGLDHHIIFLSKSKGEILDQFVPYAYNFDTQNEPTEFPSVVFSELDKSISFTIAGIDTIYSMSEYQVKPKFVFSYGKYQHEDILIGTPEARKRVLDGGSICCPEAVVETPNFLHFRVSYGDVAGMKVLYNKASGNKKIFKHRNTINSFNNLRTILPNGHFNDELVYIIPVSDIKNVVKNKQEGIKPDQLERLKELDAQLSWDDNPVLVFYKLKDF